MYKHSVLFEFNRTLTEDGLEPISVGTFHNWLKQHRLYIGICPSMSDYCDKCKEFEEEISRCQQIINRLVQNGHATEGEFITHIYMHTFIHACTQALACTHMCVYLPILTFVFFASEEIMEQKSKQLKFQEDHQKHKDDAQDALEYYRKHVVKTRTKYAQITSLLSKEHRTEAEDSMLTKLQSEYSAFVGADYMMSKNLPVWENLHNQQKHTIK